MKMICLRFLCFAGLALGLVSCVEVPGGPAYGGGYGSGYGGGTVYTQHRVNDYGYRNDYRNDYYRNDYHNDYRTAYHQDSHRDSHQNYHHDDHHDQKGPDHCYC